jgi:hypothetical protein
LSDASLGHDTTRARSLQTGMRAVGRYAQRREPGSYGRPRPASIINTPVRVAQVEELMADGMVSAKERRALLRLQESLGLDGNVAARLEAQVLDTIHLPPGKDHAEVP